MASGLFFDPIRLLRIAPLIGTTGSLAEDTAELIIFSAFTDPRLRRSADQLPPQWFATVFARAGSVLIFFNAITTSTAIANPMRDWPNGGPPPLSMKFYAAGLAAALGHMMFAPWVIGPMDAPVWNITNDRAKEGAVSEMRRWLCLHRMCMPVADVPAWLTCLGAMFTVSPL